MFESHCLHLNLHRLQKSLVLAFFLLKWIIRIILVSIIF
ncbi:hypothetical protein [Escherichia phage BI-EHEC]|nr:hypothetical protein [Escherichia phage BI-EHEC]